MIPLKNYQISKLRGALNLLKGFVFLLGIFFCLLAIKFGAETFSTATQMAFALLAGFLMSILIIGLGVLGHEAIHGQMHPIKFFNDLGGIMFTVMALVPYYSSRQVHLQHHRLAHKGPQDPEYYFHQGSIWSHIFFGSSRYGWLHLRDLLVRTMKFSKLRPEHRKEIFLDFISLVLTVVVVVKFIQIFNIPVFWTVFSFYLTMPIVFAMRYMADHRGLPKVKSHSQSQAHAWCTNTNKLMEWLWSHINYHGVHHRFPTIPHGNLAEVYELTKSKVDYPVLKSGYLGSVFWLFQQPYFGAEPAKAVEVTLANPGSPI